MVCLAGAWPLAAAPAAAVPNFPTARFLGPAIADLARAHAYPIAGIEDLAGDEAGQTGNSLTFLVTLAKGGRQKQWLVQLKISALTAQERASVRHKTMGISISGGRHFDFNMDANTAIDVRTAGPFTADPADSVEEKRGRTAISQDLLRLGLDRACEVFHRKDLAFAASKNTAKSAPATSLSDEEARAFAGLFPALITFVQEIEETPGIDGILWAILDKPSVWSVVRHGGKVQVGVTVEDPAVIDSLAWRLPDPPYYRLPVMISVYDRPALHCFLYVTSPRPPLVASAGIVGIVAVPPSRPADRLEIRLIAAHLR